MAEVIMNSINKNFILEYYSADENGIDYLSVVHSEEVNDIIVIALFSTGCDLQEKRKLYDTTSVKYFSEVVPITRSVEEFKIYAELVDEALDFGEKVQKYLADNPKWSK